MRRVDRRAVLAGLGALPLIGAAPAPTHSYTITPEPIGDGIWIVRGADAPIEAANGGAIANITIITTPKGTVLVDAGPSLRYGTQLKAVAEALGKGPVVRVYATHLHPDHSFGIAAFDPGIVAATGGTIDEMGVEGAGFSDGMYRLLGDWMRGTELPRPGRRIGDGMEDFGGRILRSISLAGHSGSDLAILDERTGILIAGDLVFHDRAPSTPHADLAKWRGALDALKALPHKSVVPGHGPFDPTPATAIDQTRDWIDWLEGAMTQAVASGLDMVEAGEMDIPARFSGIAAARYEVRRSASHLYPGLEAKLLPRVDEKN
ncbi:quinoprotein relay system zinc metallohydrolase 1 [Sphingomonas naphthae]|uniref:Quinoprotein relay system zinc metallohydrolase 1 n=1 Tax=Sphingomonas naphthae TaxID=1813468 RepID=A0ABY7TLE7_9SPHN|nr:quinoprotein relay system zinc metallohydrolase 1 [Sphingomonas naphthae]WCT73210.1 quinoprotein relay system zinc metallohydrolase 1 [Sphingomonas naphthae]